MNPAGAAIVVTISVVLVVAGRSAPRPLCAEVACRNEVDAALTAVGVDLAVGAWNALESSSALLVSSSFQAVVVIVLAPSVASDSCSAVVDAVAISGATELDTDPKLADFDVTPSCVVCVVAVDNGPAEGVADGAKDGVRVGIDDGPAEGAADGVRVGIDDGPAEGAADGTRDGVGDGLSDGLRDGDTASGAPGQLALQDLCDEQAS